MAEPALHRGINDLRIGISKEPLRLLQTHFHLFRPDRNAELLLEEPAEMTLTATALAGQFPNRVILQLACSHLVHQAGKTRLRSGDRFLGLCFLWHLRRE